MIQQPLYVYYRGTYGAPIKDQFVEGTIFKDDGYVSTSHTKSGSFGGDVKMRITVPKGAHAIYLDDLAKHRSEDEILLPRGSKFLVTKVVVDNGYMNVELELILDEGALTAESVAKARAAADAKTAAEAEVAAKKKAAKLKEMEALMAKGG